MRSRLEPVAGAGAERCDSREKLWSEFGFMLRNSISPGPVDFGKKVNNCGNTRSNRAMRVQHFRALIQSGWGKT